MLGVPGFTEELGIVGEHCAEYINRVVHAWDDFADLTDSVLGTRSDPRKHRLVPPTVHGRVFIHRGWPDFSNESRTILFCALARDNFEPLLTVRRELLDKTTIVGRQKILQALAKKLKLKYLTIAHFEDWVAVRSETG